MTGPTPATPSAASRLPRTVAPRRYDLTIEPDLAASTFRGSVRIALDVHEATATIVLHARGLEITGTEVVQHGEPLGASTELDGATERLAVRTAAPLRPGAAELVFEFAGRISHGLLGFYRSTFTDAEGVERVLAATQFEAPHARAAFPCFDEPDFKAVFGVTLVVDDGLCALSNGPEVARTPRPDGRVEIRFGDTIPMSTYLVAWVVGPLEVTAPVDAGGVAVRVAHVPGKANLTAFALDVGSFAIRFFADYYGIPYPGTKCDLVALPDFSFGAMENLGCVTFRETRLLVDPAHATLDELAAAGLTIVHEIAHMWFGDLVTMKWWNGIWLNEAFATFMEHLGADAYRPDWRTWDDFAVGRAAALDVDALPSTRTVEYEVRTPADAEGMFDTLTYQKGGSVLRMLERWLGADAFRAGVRHYLERYRLANTETTDLWDALEEANRQPVRRIMDSWIFQPGFPVLVPEGRRLVQQRFTYAGDRASERYVVPLLVRVHTSAGAATHSLLLADDAISLDAPDDALIVCNAGGEGFYRVSYPAAWRDRLLDEEVLEPLERFALLDDLWAAVLAGTERATAFLDIARRFSRERELVVWRVLAAHLRSLARLVDGSALGRYGGELAVIAQPSLASLGWETAAGDDDRTRQRRGLVIALLGTLARDPDVLERARQVVGHPEGADADVLAACVSVVASVGTEGDFAEYVRRSREAATPQEQLRYLHALGEFPSEELVLRSCGLALSDEVRPQNAPFVLQRALRHRDHGPAAWAFVRDHWDTIRQRFSGALVSRMVEGTTWLVTEPACSDVAEFLEAHPVAEASRTIAQSLDRLRVHRAAVERERASLTARLLGAD
jgi:puromycin-sensitive aminopeptidase